MSIVNLLEKFAYYKINIFVMNTNNVYNYFFFLPSLRLI